MSDLHNHVSGAAGAAGVPCRHYLQPEHSEAVLHSQSAAGVDVSPLIEFDPDNCDNDTATIASDLNLTSIFLEGGNEADELIKRCYFMGITESFTPVVTRLGMCYSFNSDATNISTSSAPGPRFGLQLLLDIHQEEYTDTLDNDAGVAVVIHSQNEPPEPTESGLMVPPGHAARIGLTKKVVRDDSTGSSCRKAHTANFNFLPDTFDYSMSACVADSYFTEIARQCGCVDSSVLTRPSSGPFANLPDCGISHLCCSYDVFATSPPSGCLPACLYTTYSTTISYSAFPARYTLTTADLLAETNLTMEQVQQDLTVFFEELNIERQTTRDAYEVSALLSDIGGQLGLFLGASVVSILEFVLWMMDEVKDRCVGVNDRKLAHWLRRRIRQCRRWEREVQAQLDSLELEMNKTVRSAEDKSHNS